MKIRQTTRHGNVVWELDTGIIDGQRRRMFFNKEKAARLKMAEVEADFAAAGRRWSSTVSSDKAKIIRILDEIEAKGYSLEQVWNTFQAGKITCSQSAKKLSDGIDEVLEIKKAANRRPAYLAELARY